MKFNRTITLGNLLTIIGYLIFGIYLTAKLSIGQEYLREQINEVKVGMQKLSERIDYHIERSK